MTVCKTVDLTVYEGSSPSRRIENFGEMAEWLKAVDCLKERLPFELNKYNGTNIRSAYLCLVKS